MKARRTLLGWLCALSLGFVSLPVPAAARHHSDALALKLSSHIKVCGGLCPDYDIIVAADGAVAVVSDAGSPFEQRAAYRVSPADAARVRSLLLSLGKVYNQAFCPRPTGEDRWSSSENDLEVRLMSPIAPSRLVACDNKQDANFLAAVHQALSILNLNFMGHVPKP